MEDNKTQNLESSIEKLAVALDFADEKEAMKFVGLMEDRIKIYKVGLELFSVSGPQFVSKLIGLGYDVFVDLKLHDIPNTVYGAAKALGKLGARFITAHSSGGVEMLQAANEGFNEGCSDGGWGGLRYCLGVSVLTSDPYFTDQLLFSRVETIVTAGLKGLVCSGTDLSKLTQKIGHLFKVVPGVRPVGSFENDQLRVTTPSNAIASGADLLVVGRPITLSSNPIAATNEILRSIFLAN
jgi:orotidine-5'-phosphate decarboxylase